VPVSVDVPAGATAEFGEGPVPPGALDARPGWSRRPAPAAPAPPPQQRPAGQMRGMRG
jgi:hypothetical protein